MNKLLIIALALGVSACTETQPKESYVYEGKSFKSSESTYDDRVTVEENTFSEKGQGQGQGQHYQNYRNYGESYPNGSESEKIFDGQDVYTVNKDDTLMKIAFNIYGDYNMWKSLKASNDRKINSDNTIFEGMTLSYQKPKEVFVQNKNGAPYLIVRGDTLSSISRDTYRTSAYWTKIWENNKQLIKDPNKIFAGFTIYLPEIND